MKNTVKFLKQENDNIAERYNLAMERITNMLTEDTVPELYQDYFKKYAQFILLLKQTAESVKSGKLYKKALKTLAAENHKFYEDILPENYEKSYANPAYATSIFGIKYGRALSVLAAELRTMIQCAYEYRLFEITIATELFISIYNVFESSSDSPYKEIKELIYYYVHDYYEDFNDKMTRDSIDPEYTFARDIIMEADLTDIKYLYYFGDYISENEILTAKHLNSMDEEAVKKMADTYVDGYVRGFVTMGADLDKKSIVLIRYCIGFEPMMKHAVKRFEDMGKKVTFKKYNTHLANRTPATRKMGYHSVGPSLQYEYDHRFDNAFVFNRKLMDRMLKASRSTYEKYKDLYASYAGPAVQETFGESYTEPYVKSEALKRDKRQQKLFLELNNAKGIMSGEYIKSEETSFTIIAYPLPSIGENFNEIFDETVKINNLDNNLYIRIQQHLIDALDSGVYCSIKGMEGNKTDLRIMLHKLNDRSKETNFENCTADVNIPAGEVFTSPVLKGTNGILHVSKVFINGLAFKDLIITFKDGMATKYTCNNFEKEEDNIAYVWENIMKNHDTLPIGEFAIGTNTIAYVMARKYNIQDKLPILIAEKTGPHFAVGDTCYARSEDHKLYNPDGKEIIARDNECSILRKTEMDKAYFNCHTDITIPYNEIMEISVHQEDGNKIMLIENTRFVLSGTEELNKAFD